MVVLDTSIIIDHLRQKGAALSALEKIASVLPKEELAISVATVQELYTGASSADARAEAYLLATITPLRILPYTYATARRAGELGRDCPGALTFADAVIAATALVHNASLATLNQKDFAAVPHLSLWKDITREA